MNNSRILQNVMLVLLSLFMAMEARAATPEVNGLVVDNNNEPLPGVVVTIDGTKVATRTGTDGKFSLAAAVGARLVFSYIGYETKKVTVADPEKSLTVVMVEESSELDEVVVVGYGTQKKSDISTAVQSVNVEELTKSGSTQVLQALQGKVSGLQVMQSDGSVNGNVTFRMRGVNSITGGTQPLIVIDGVPMPVGEDTNSSSKFANNPLMGLNPNDIASMEVLKDAAAAAIYGAKGSNGVIIITTKKGEQAAKPKYSFRFNGGVDFKPSPRLEVLTPEQYAHKMLNYGTYNNPEVTNFWTNVIEGKKWNDPSVHNWMDEITQAGQKYDANLSMSGGTLGTTYMASLGYMNNTGIIRRSRFDRLTARLNLTQQLRKNMSMGLNTSYASSKDHNPTTDWSQEGVVLNALVRSPFLNYPGFADLMNYQNINIMSPLVAVDQVDISNRYRELNGNAWYSWTIIPDLTFNAGVSYRTYTIKSSRVWGPDTWWGQSERGRLESINHDENSWVTEARLNYNKTLGLNNFTLMGAFEGSKWWMNNNYEHATNFDDLSGGIYDFNRALVAYAPEYTYSSDKTLSWIFRGSYSFDNRYVLNASLRADGSSKFGRNHKWGYFPAVSVAWRASEEAFLRDVQFISNLRLRASFGMTGNNQIPAYQSLSQLAANKVVFNGSQVENGRYPINITNDDLKWESQKQYNIGLDLYMWDNRLQLTADFYYKRVDDMLLNVNIPSTSGYVSAWKNAGSLSNKGFDISLTAHWFRGKFSWDTDFNISMYRNKIIKLDGGQYQQFYDRGINSKITGDVVLRVGQPVGVYYGYISDGTYNNDNEIANGYPGSNLTKGELKVVDVNQDGIIDSNDRVPIANVNPKHTGGIGNTLKWKEFDLYAFFRWSYGNDVINGNAYYLQGATNINNIMASTENQIWNENHTDRNFPLSGAGTWSEGVMRSDLVEDGSFLRLQTLSLGYTLPAKVLRKAGLSKMRFVLTGTNLWLLTRYSGFDPEANTGWGTIARIAPGMDMSPYPLPKSLTFGLELNF